MALGRTGAEIKAEFLGVQDSETYDLKEAKDLTDGTTYTPVLIEFRGNIEYTNDLGVKIVTHASLDLSVLTKAERDKILGLLEGIRFPSK